jgi:YbbR domain-containing protein
VIEVPRNGPVVRQDQLQAVLDASDLVDPGYHNVQVKLVAPDVAIKSLSPASVTLSLDRLDERTVPVSIVYSGESSGVVVESTHVDPALTTIRGVGSDLARVSTVRVSIPIPGKPQRLDAMLQPAPIDARGSEITGVQVSPNLVRVRAAFVAPLAPAK